MRRLAQLLSVLMMFALLAGACAAPAPAAEAPANGATEAPAVEGEAQAGTAGGEKQKVTIFIGMGTGTDPDQIAAQEALQEQFNSTHDNIEIEFLIVPVEEAGERFLAMMAGGNAPQLVGPNGISTVAQFYDSWADV